ncbi:conserved hypothetical protein [Anaeromyxobacter sp. K]|uniref:hypothetical protein n=1 Tax=Anaeromyxobacter sp. (strain K) TaxID=447217 RepID=UPI00015F8A53|nr:hypothetical protein [Anaeromyxobacter sp. K]ACG72938.1 conserved hypothetical protein [Anaeromyxobacter sp. K]
MASEHLLRAGALAFLLAMPSPWLAAQQPAAEPAAPAPAEPAAAAAPDAAAPEPTAPPGDPAIGRDLFIGARALRNGGAPCGACHAIGGEGSAFAASFGPGLRASFDGLDAAALDGLLSDPPFPSMVPVYAGHPLDPDERAHLSAFLLGAAGKPEPGAGRAGWIAALIALACLAGIGLGARRIPGSARAELVARARLAPPPRRTRPSQPTRPAASAAGAAPTAPAKATRAQGGVR